MTPGERRKNRAKKLRRRRENRERLDALKEQAPCADCGRTFPAAVMEFDHRDRASKRKNVARLVQTVSWNAVLLEIAKCDLVCANCHRLRSIAGQHHLPIAPAVRSATPQLELIASRVPAPIPGEGTTATGTGPDGGAQALARIPGRKL